MVELADVRDVTVGEVTYLRNLVTRLAEMLAPADVAVLASQKSGRLTVAAASTTRAHNLASLDAEQQHGPGTDAFRSGHGVRNRRLVEASERWPAFTARAGAAGFGLVTSLVMRRLDDVIGAVSVLCSSEHPLSDADVSLAQVLAEVATTGILLNRELRRASLVAAQLQYALESRVIVEQAKGALAAWLGIAPDQAFELLRGYARRNSSRLADVAALTIRGELSAGSLLGDDKEPIRTPKC